MYYNVHICLISHLKLKQIIYHGLQKYFKLFICVYKTFYKKTILLYIKREVI